MKLTIFAVVAVVLIIFGLSRLSKGHRTEGGAEIFAGVLELLAEILGAML